MRAMKTALLVVWSVIGAWCAVAFYVLGVDGWIPSLWPVIFGVLVTWRIIHIVRAHQRAITSGAANISQKPTAARRSQTQS